MNLRKVNRGLVLGAVLIVGTAVYVVADMQSFKKDKPAIEEISKNFTEALAKSNIGTSDNNVDQWKKLIDDYFTDYKVSEYDVRANKSMLLQQMSQKNSYADESGKFNANIQKSQIFPKNFQVSKYGPNGALVTFDYSFYIDFVGQSERHFDFNGIDYASSFYYGDEDFWSEKFKDKLWSYSDNGTAELYFVKKDNTWKIATIQSLENDPDVNLSDQSSAEDDTVTDSNAEGDKS